MRRTLSPWLVLLGTSLLSAQEPNAAADPLIAGKQRLNAALQKTAATNDVAFRASWGSAQKKKEAATPAFATNMAAAAGKITGSWHDGLEHVAFDNPTEDWLWRSNGVTVACDKDRDWCIRKNRFADGNAVSFPGDVASLLRQLASMDLAVVQRSPGAIDDRPVEIVTVTLSPDQVTELVRGEHVPEALVSAMPGLQFAMFAGGDERRAEAQRPTSTVDVAIALDPGTSLVHELRFRSWTKVEGNGRNFVIRGGGGGGAGAVRVIGGNNADEEEEDEAGDTKAADEMKPGAPMPFENGLPVRPRKKMSVMDFTVRLAEHGTKKAPELDATVRKLLGR